jgi:hypothetical protein
MDDLRQGDLFDWRGCSAVQFDPEKLGDSRQLSHGCGRRSTQLRGWSECRRDQRGIQHGSECYPCDSGVRQNKLFEGQRLKVLLDHNLTEHLAPHLPGHEVRTAKQMLWSELRNGNLLRAAEEAGFDVMLTADQYIAYQQNHQTRKIALVVVNTNRIAKLLPHAKAITEALSEQRWEAMSSSKSYPGRGAPSAIASDKEICAARQPISDGNKSSTTRRN